MTEILFFPNSQKENQQTESEHKMPTYNRN